MIGALLSSKQALNRVLSSVSVPAIMVLFVVYSSTADFVFFFS